MTWLAITAGVAIGTGSPITRAGGPRRRTRQSDVRETAWRAMRRDGNRAQNHLRPGERARCDFARSSSVVNATSKRSADPRPARSERNGRA
jgi:hypothetical protein